MLLIKPTLASLIVGASLLFSPSIHASSSHEPGLTHAAWKRVSPYLMPDNHPIRAQLDAFFKQKRWTFSSKTFKEAGFSSWKTRPFSRLIVATHPDFPGYVFKVFLDVQRYYMGFTEWELWARRVEGVNLVKKEIEKMGWEAYMKTPTKWIYPLPAKPKIPEGYLTKYFILVEEDVELLSKEDNEKKWKSPEVTTEDLTRLHHVLSVVGLSDCAKTHNAPWTKDGRIAFIDTQSFNQKVTWDSLDRMLSPDNKLFWREITKKDR